MADHVLLATELPNNELDCGSQVSIILTHRYACLNTLHDTVVAAMT